MHDSYILRSFTRISNLVYQKKSYDFTDGDLFVYNNNVYKFNDFIKNKPNIMDVTNVITLDNNKIHVNQYNNNNGVYCGNVDTILRRMSNALRKATEFMEYYNTRIKYKERANDLRAKIDRLSYAINLIKSFK